ncbi:MAG: endonuclease MutS2 [Gemmiger sp.]|uniref:endonuclease MutS2 n=1 Tax=Gemmiger sp. TaxID=2049027 RepID=UPI002A917E26|nr:endonuclease MutS2 [Gemmiger sp.]MDD6423976.1 endonuclease MutS2 [Subdoligranulum variabile]MDD6609927.1 endonuclease MutS2 [Subdoligranulum variabile]MDD6649671.1 endonuclease MutS2 [Subdoligranulum variabile]MDY5412081.1 endonuclease MutS2 [Gemmiger sp.]
MDTAYKKTLELDKVLARAVQLCACRETKEMMQTLQPCETPEDERYALEQTNAINSLLIKNGSPRFGSVSEVRRVVSHAQKGGILSMGELLEIAATLRNFAGLSQWYGLSEHDMMPTDDLFYSLAPQPVLERQISDSILSPEEMADTASTTLADLRRKIRQTEDSIRTKLDAIIKNSTTNKFLQDAVVSLRNGRYVVPVRAEYRGEVGGVIHDVSSTGATVFVEPTAVVEANARIMQLRAQEQEEITRILSAFSAQVGSLEPQFSYSYDAMLKIDLLLAKARLAIEQGAFMPAVSDTIRFKLNKARHPLIDKKKVVPVDIALGDEYDTLVITGPNTGGKTVSLKTAGLLNAMAQYGFLIPAHESSVVCTFREYFVDIGDEQSIEQSLSTFSGHMKRISGILDLAGHGTLTLLDELGAGTDPAEGAALAVSILEQLRRQGSLLMATTHYAEMKVYALETPGVVNASCEFNVETLMPTYKLSVGVPGKSNAFLISAKLGIPQNIIDAARSHMSNDDKRLDSVLAQLDDLKLQLKEAQGDAEKARYEAEHALESAEKKRDDLIKKGEQELEDARRRAHELMQNVQNEAYALTDELRRIQKDEKTSAAQRAVRAREIARKDTETLLKKTDSKPKPTREFVPLKEVQIGQEVLIADLNQLATVTARPDRNGMVEVRAGIMKTKVPLAGLCAPDKMDKRPAREPRRSSTRVQLDKSRKASMEINLLGYTVDEALAEVDKFLDSGMLRGQQTLYIIHGNGTGALRTAIQKHLRTHKAVKSFRPGRYGEGENGVTVVELK